MTVFILHNICQLLLLKFLGETYWSIDCLCASAYCWKANKILREYKTTCDGQDAVGLGRRRGEPKRKAINPSSSVLPLLHMAAKAVELTSRIDHWNCNILVTGTRYNIRS